MEGFSEPIQPKKKHHLFYFVIGLIFLLTTVFVVSMIVVFNKIYPTSFSRAATITWTGVAGDGLWETAGNWSGSTVPTATDDVTINSDEETVVTLSAGQTANFNSLTIGGGGVFINTLILEGTIGSGRNITLDTAGWLYQKNITTQTISGALVVKNGGTLTHTANTNNKSYIVNFRASVIDIQSGGAVLASGKGYGSESTGPGPGLTATNEGMYFTGGGAHGGDGGTYGDGAGGVAYCTVTDISTMGSSGGLAGQDSDSLGHGAGGGLVILNSTATTTINGSVTADGNSGASLTSIGGAFSAGGGGGGIRITAGKAIAGTPTSMSARGGNGFGESSAAGGGGCIQLAYHTTSSVTELGGAVSVDAGTSFIGSGQTAGLFHIAQFNGAPTTTVPSPSQTALNEVTFSTAVSDSDLDVTSLIVEYSLNGVTWASSTLGSVTASQGTVATSTGRITGIASDTSTTTLTIVWNSGIDAPGINTSTAYIRILPNDGSLNGALQTSAVFSVINAIPSDLTVNQMTDQVGVLSWATDTAYTAFYLQDQAGTVSSDWMPGYSYTFSNLRCGTQYAFRIKGRNGESVETEYSSTVATSTISCGQAFSASGGGGGGAAPSSPSAPAATPASPAPSSLQTQSSVVVPDFLKPAPEPRVITTPLPIVPPTLLAQPITTLPALPPAPLVPSAPVTVVFEEVVRVNEQQRQIAEAIAEASQTITPSLNSETPVTIGAQNHTVTVAEATPERIVFLLRSEPLHLTLENGEERQADTDRDGVPDVLVSYKGLLGGKPLLSLAPLTDHSETSRLFTINAGAFQVNSTDVTLLFSGKDIASLEVADNPDFTNSVHFVAASSTRWRLPAQPGVATVYARLYKTDGTVFVLSDSIFVLPSAVPGWGEKTAAATGSLSKPTSTPRSIFKAHLEFGSVGSEVRALQAILKTQGFFPATTPITGYFGPITRQAVRLLQKKFNLTPIGQVGPATRALLNSL